MPWNTTKIYITTGINQWIPSCWEVWNVYQQHVLWFKPLKRRKRQALVYLKVDAFIMGFQQRHPPFTTSNDDCRCCMTHRKSRKSSRVLWFGFGRLFFWNQVDLKIVHVSGFDGSNHVRVLKSLSELEGVFVKDIPWNGIRFVSERPVSLRHQENYVPKHIVGPRFHFCDHCHVDTVDGWNPAPVNR